MRAAKTLVTVLLVAGLARFFPTLSAPAGVVSLTPTYARRPLNAHSDFYALWADGNGREPSESCLYFTNQKGDHVWRLLAKMETDFAKPEIAW